MNTIIHRIITVLSISLLGYNQQIYVDLNYDIYVLLTNKFNEWSKY